MNESQILDRLDRVETMLEVLLEVVAEMDYPKKTDRNNETDFNNLMANARMKYQDKSNRRIFKE